MSNGKTPIFRLYLMRFGECSVTNWINRQNHNECVHIHINTFSSVEGFIKLKTHIKSTEACTKYPQNSQIFVVRSLCSCLYIFRHQYKHTDTPRAYERQRDQCWSTQTRHRANNRFVRSLSCKLHIVRAYTICFRQIYINRGCWTWSHIHAHILNALISFYYGCLLSCCCCYCRSSLVDDGLRRFCVYIYQNELVLNRALLILRSQSYTVGWTNYAYRHQNG